MVVPEKVDDGYHRMEIVQAALRIVRAVPGNHGCEDHTEPLDQVELNIVHAVVLDNRDCEDRTEP